MTPRPITGIGVVSAIGIGREAFLEGLRTGTTPANDASEVVDRTKCPGLRVAEVRGFDATRFLGDKGLRSLDRLTKLLVVATRLALEDAGLKRDAGWLPPPEGRPAWPERAGMVVSNAYGSLEAIHELDTVAVLEDRRYINPARFPLTVSNSAAGYASIWEDLRALNVSVSDGNCGALDAAMCAEMFLAQGRADALVVGGAEALTDALTIGFGKVGAAAAGACIGEGAALFVLETSQSARRRGARVLAEAIGFGTSFDGPEADGALLHASAPSLERAVRAALGDAGITAGDVDLVVSGAAGLPAFDLAEGSAIERALGDGVPIVLPKRLLGETLGAGGAMGALVAVADLAYGARLPPVRGAVRGAARPVRTALVTSMGFYGNSSALVIRSASG